MLNIIFVICTFACHKIRHKRFLLALRLFITGFYYPCRLQVFSIYGLVLFKVCTCVCQTVRSSERSLLWGSVAWVVVKCKKIFTAHNPWTKYEDNHPPRINRLQQWWEWMSARVTRERETTPSFVFSENLKNVFRSTVFYV